MKLSIQSSASASAEGAIPKRACFCALTACMVLLAVCGAQAQLVPGSMDIHWSEGAKDCKISPQAPIQVYAYNPRTIILRENPCATFEAPFMYLLIGSKKALLIDTGDVADPQLMPLAATVIRLLPEEGSAKLPLLVVHTHRHLDHRAGDGQFLRLPNVQVVGFDIDSVRRYYGFINWPNGLAQIELGDRTVDVMPTPGHNETEVSFYDRETGLFFSGDFLMPGRLLIDDTDSDLTSAKRAAAFAQNHPISYVLGGHIEVNINGDTFPWESRYHPDEHPLQMTKNDLLALPAAIGKFNGFYTRSGHFILMNPMRLLVAVAVLGMGGLVMIGSTLILYIRRRRRRTK